MISEILDAGLIMTYPDCRVRPPLQTIMKPNEVKWKGFVYCGWTDNGGIVLQLADVYHTVRRKSLLLVVVVVVSYYLG